MKMFHLPGDGPVQLSPVWSAPMGAIIFRCASEAAPWGWGAPYGTTAAGKFTTLDGDYSRMQAVNPMPGGEYKITYGFKHSEFHKDAPATLDPAARDRERQRMHKDGYWPYGANHWVYRYGGKVLGYLSWGSRRREHMSCCIKTGYGSFQPQDATYPEQWVTAPQPGYRKSETQSLDPLEMLKKLLGGTADQIDSLIEKMLNSGVATLGLGTTPPTSPPPTYVGYQPPATPLDTSRPTVEMSCAPQAKYDFEQRGSIWLKGVRVHVADVGFTNSLGDVICAAVRTIPYPDRKPDRYLLYVTAGAKQIGSNSSGNPIQVGANFQVCCKKLGSKGDAQVLMEFNPTTDLPQFDTYELKFVWPGHRDRWNYLTMGDDFKGVFNESATRASFVLPVFATGTGYDEHQWPEWENGKQCWTTCVMHLDFPDGFLAGGVDRSYEPIVLARANGQCERVCPSRKRDVTLQVPAYEVANWLPNTTKTIWRVGTWSTNEHMTYNVDTGMDQWQTLALDYDGDQELRLYAQVRKYVHWHEESASSYEELLDADNRNLGAGYADVGWAMEKRVREDYLGVTYKFQDRTWVEYQKFNYNLDYTVDNQVGGVESAPYLDPLHGHIPAIQENFWRTAFLYENVYDSYWEKVYDEELIRWLAVDLKNDFFAYVRYGHKWKESVEVRESNHSEKVGGATWGMKRVVTRDIANTIPHQELIRFAEVVINGQVVQRMEGLASADSPSVSWPFMTLNQYHRIGASFLTRFEMGYTPAEYISSGGAAASTNAAKAAAKNGLDYNTTWYGYANPANEYKYDYSPELVRMPPLQLYDYYQIPSWRPLNSQWTETVFAAPLQRFCARILAQTTPYYDEYAKRMNDKTWTVGVYPYQAVTSYEVPNEPRTLITLLYPTITCNIGTNVSNDNKCYTQLTGVEDVGAFLQVPGDARITSLGII